MNAVRRSVSELKTDILVKAIDAGEDLQGTLLAASSSHNANEKQQIKIIRMLLKAGVDVNETDKNGVTPLHRAVRFRNTGAVIILIEKGADIDAVDKKSLSTPLHRVVTNTGAPSTAGKSDSILKIAKTLLAKGANTQIKNKKGKLASEYIKNESLLKIFQEYEKR